MEVRRSRAKANLTDFGRFEYAKERMIRSVSLNETWR